MEKCMCFLMCSGVKWCTNYHNFQVKGDKGERSAFAVIIKKKKYTLMKF